MSVFYPQSPARSITGIFTLLLGVQLFMLGTSLYLVSGDLVGGGFASHTNDLHFSASFQEPTAPTSAASAVPASPVIADTEAIAPRAEEPSSDDETTDNSVHYIVKGGDTFAAIFNSLGVPRAEGLRATQALKDKNGAALALRVGEAISVRLSTDGHILELSRSLASGALLNLRTDSQGAFEVSESTEGIVEEDRVVSGVITSSLAAAAKEAAVPFSVIDDFVDLFSSRVEFKRDLHAGDSFTITYLERRNGAGAILKAGVIKSASLKVGGTIMAAVRYEGEDGKASYFDEKGNPLGKYFLRYPLKFSRISSAFSYARFHPVLQRTRPHNGVDFAAPIGTPVRAVADGIVELAGNHGDAGNMVKLSHGDRFATAYLHLSKISPLVRQGSRVMRGEVIGTVGMTGLATGPHLHFSLYDRGKYVNPLSTSSPVMTSNLRSIPREVLVAALESMRLQHAVVASANVNEHAA